MIVLLVCLLAGCSDIALAVQACCQSGYQCASDGSSTICQPGTMGGQSCAQRVSCYDCGIGYYQSYAGQTFCLECPDGYQCPYARTISPLTCPPGTRGGKNVTEKYTCYDCGAGYYQQFAGHTTCDACPDGYMCPNARTSNPVECLPGTRSGQSGDDRSRCYECGFGYYQQYSGQTSCSACPDGYSCPLTNTSSPVQCVTGSAAALAAPVSTQVTNAPSIYRDFVPILGLCSAVGVRPVASGIGSEVDCASACLSTANCVAFEWSKKLNDTTAHLHATAVRHSEILHSTFFKLKTGTFTLTC